MGIKPWEVEDREPTREDVVYMLKCKGLRNEFADRFRQPTGDTSPRELAAKLKARGK